MGVRGRVEAVIYAAEEPVTLQQLAKLFGGEALAERAAARHESAETAGPLPYGTAAAAGEEKPEPAVAISAGAKIGDEMSAGGDTTAAPAVQVSQAYQAEGEPLRLGDPDADKRAAHHREREGREAMQQILRELTAEYDRADRGMEIREVAGGYRIATKPEYHDAVRVFAKSLKPPMKLTLQALETLAVIAYKQPVTSPEISEIRGVDSGGVLGSLISRKLVTTAGRKPVVGRPILYKTTKEFLLRFGLKDLAELPSMEEFEKLAGELQASGETAEAEEPGALEPTAPMPAGEDAAPEPAASERPSLAPSEISVSVEEAEPAIGVSVNNSGRPVPDPDVAQVQKAEE